MSATSRATYRWIVGDLRTGKISRTVDLTSTSYTSAFNGDETLSGSFPLRAINAASGKNIWSSARADTAPGKAFLAVAYVDNAGNETFLAGGPIWTTAYTYETGLLQINAAGLNSYFDHRKVMLVLAPTDDPAAATVTYTGNQLGLIAKQLVALSQSHTAGNLPIVLPADSALGGAGTTLFRTYPGYALTTVGAELHNLASVVGGPEIQFIPSRATDPRYLQWTMRIGVAPSMLLTQTGKPWVFDATVPNGPVAGISVNSDGSAMGTRAWVAGQGQAEGRPIAYANNTSLTDSGWPLLEVEAPGTDTVSETKTLADYANALLAVSSKPLETWTPRVAIDGTPNLAAYRPGDWATLRIRNDVFLPDGDFNMRILTVSGDGSQFVNLAMAPRLGAY